MSALLDTRLPIVAAPMAGGPSTVALAAAVTAAGGFGFLAGGNKTVETLSDEIEQLRPSAKTFGVNLFVPPTTAVDPSEFRDYVTRLQPEAAAHGLELNGVPHSGDDQWNEKVAMLLHHPVPVVSLTFGLVPAADIAALQSVGSRVLATVTNPTEAIAAVSLGVDGLTVQGYRAGGHSAVHDVRSWPQPLETAELVKQVRQRVDVPLIAAGGVTSAQEVSDLLDAGAEAVAVGTMLLRTDEAGTSVLQRSCMVAPERSDTVLTRAFTGRPARALRNGFTDRHNDSAPSGYPEVHYMTRALRVAAGQAQDTDRVHMWAGTGFRAAPTGPAGEVVRLLAGTA